MAAAANDAAAAAAADVSIETKNQRMPIVGVLCIDVAQKLTEIYGAFVKSYIAASYVKWLEGAGARVVPIWIGQLKSYYEDIMSKINGILIPGGAVFFNAKYITRPELHNDCVQSSKFIFEIAKEKNTAGEYFPIWGTCLGMELLLLHSADGVDPRQDCEHMDYALPIIFEEDFNKSKLFQSLSNELKEIMQTIPFGYHFHRYCITKKDLLQFKISNHWHVLATNKDVNGLEFISIIEHRIYPFYGVQFHPERIRYEQFGEHDKCLHNASTINASQYLVNFFVMECCKSTQHFTSYEEESKHSIWNYEVKFTGQYQNVHWQQCFLFGDMQSGQHKNDAADVYIS